MGGVTRFRVHLLVVLTVAFAALSGISASFRAALTDLRFQWTSRPASGDIVLIAIDPRSIEHVGVWPWPRALHGQLVRKLDAAGVSDIVFDVDFSSPSNSTDDDAFAEALRAANGSVVLPIFQQARSAGSTLLHQNRPLPAFASRSWTAAVNVPVEPDGRVRNYPIATQIDNELVPSMAAVLAEHQSLSPRSFVIDFGIRSNTVPILSYVDVLNSDIEGLKRLAGKKVVVGGAALELGDRFSVPNGAVLPGPLLQILAAESIAQKRMLTPTSIGLTVLGVAVVAFLMFVLWRRKSVGLRVATLLGMAAGTEVVALLVQRHFPFIVDTSSLQIAILGYLVVTALDEIDFRGMLARVAERRFQRIAMSLGDGVICADGAFNITAWNPAAEAIFGYAASDVVGRPFDIVLAPAEVEGERMFSLSTLPVDRLQAVGGHMIEFKGRRIDGEIIAVEGCFSAWQGTEGFSYGASLRNVSARQKEAERMRYLAEFDCVTELPNAYLLESRLNATIADSVERGGSAALILINLENLQQTNMLKGQAFGEHVLRAAGARLQQSVSGAALVARLSGDEFAILVDRSSRDTAYKLSQSCAHAFDHPLLIGESEHKVAVRLGIAILPEDGASVEEALGNAHVALYQSKLKTKRLPAFYSARDRQKIENRLSIELELVRALARNEFELFYQPQVLLADRTVIGAEALIRWRHPTRGLVPPAEFIEIANSSAISGNVASWVLLTACQQASAWAAGGNPIRIGVNLSPSQFLEGDLCDEVAQVLKSTNLSASLLELEVTEDILLDDAERVLPMVARLQQLGVRLVFDDFGTGFGSLSYLKTFPLNGLKIDRSFVRELSRNGSDQAIVQSTIALGRALRLSVIAEGIEDAETADVLSAMGCQEGQGYYFGKPCTSQEFERSFISAEGLVA
jgi:diguanylate cyclase (GGDEF)-like protein/PAS domain S-box-containing protein